MSHHLFLLLLLIIITSTSFQIITGKIPVGSSITAAPNATPWLSPSGDFAFGFQPLQNNNLFVLAVWFARIPDRTIAWFNTLESDNGLVLRDPTNNNNKIITPYTGGLTAYAHMNDTGNLVILSDNNSSAAPLWQSFQNPSDTMLPTQTISADLPHQLVSKKLSDFFSYGRFYAGMSSDGHFALSTKSVRWNLDFDDEYYNSGTGPSGYRLVLDVDRNPASVSVVDRNGQGVKTLLTSSSPLEYYFRATLEFDGVFTLYSHPKKSSVDDGNYKWVAEAALPGNICMDIDGQKGSGACGFNNVCGLGAGSRPVCECPEGFELVDPSDRYGDCKSNFTGNCGVGSGEEWALVVVKDVDWPFNDYEQRNRSSWDECRDACYEDCFCGAAIFRSDSCWKKRLPLSNGRVDKSLNATAFLKVRIS